MAIFSYTFEDSSLNLPIYRFGVDLGAVISLDQQSLIAVLGEAVGTGDGNTVLFPLDFDRVREGSVHVFLDAVETFDFTVNLFTGAITFDTAPAVDVVITADYNYEGDITITFDTTLPMTISGNTLFEFNRVLNDIGVAQGVQTYFTADSTTSGGGDDFSFVITVNAI